jgi:hypothetical protein
MTVGACKSRLWLCQETRNRSTLRQFRRVGSCPRARATRHRAPGARARQGAFPDPQDRPAGCAQSARHGAVALRVPRKLRCPILDTGCRDATVSRTAVPETSIHKDRDLLLAKDEIRLPRQRRSASPAGDAMRTKQCNHPKFCVAISARADQRHHHASLRRRENVSHVPAGRPTTWTG